MFLTLEKLLHVAERTLAGPPVAGDLGLLESALDRSRATAFGREAYPRLDDKAGALVHALVRNHALVDGNKHVGLMGLIVFLGVSGRRLTWTNDEAYEVIIEIAEGRMEEVRATAERIRSGSEVG